MGVSLTVFFCTGTWSRSGALESFPSAFTEKFTDTWPAYLNPNGLQNTTKPHQNMSRNRPKFKYGSFYKIIMIPKSFTLSAIKQRRLCCPLSPDPNLWASAATKEWTYGCHGQKFKLPASQVFLFQLVLAAANLPEMSITYSQFSSSVHICTTQNVSLQCKTDDTKWETGPEVLLLWVLKSSNAATLPWGW